MYDLKMKPTISFKFPDGSAEQPKDSVGRSSHLEWNKGPGSRFAKTSELCPKVIAFEMSNKYCWSLLNKFLSISGCPMSTQPVRVL
ncbi:hypothetical protein AVEN_49670-1 [Araneus ventricosus]|uniref:Uncharacterized protein n=1 Tax=Araneus ventricosus TaxID=182803 RepID=A0A4Y2VPG2_ARAVE|nr:hypothetical protein AVEN_49670-1 [Araneus ventricosus]